MKIKRLFLVIFIILVFSACFYHMNLNFDKLSRYPYVNEESRELIRRYLSEDEINYIIEYDISPSYFKEYLTYPNFNIYHVESYNNIKNTADYLSTEEVINFTETLLDLNRFSEGLSLIKHYTKDEVIYWLKNGDIYNPDATLVEEPNRMDVTIDKGHTLSIKKPNDLENKTINGQEVLLRIEAMRNLEEMLQEMPYKLKITDSYISYEAQIKKFNNDSENKCDHDLPGHSEHQLGLAFDLDIDVDSKAYKWLLEHSQEYGFYFSYPDRENHLRYKGVNE